MSVAEMKILRKLLRESRIKLLALLVVATATIFVYTSSSTLLSNRIIATKSALLVEKPSTKSSPSIVNELIPPGGTFYRNSFLNRTKVERTVDNLVGELRLNRSLDMRERRELRREREQKLEELMDANLQEIELETWNLDNYYPRTPKVKTPVSIPKQSNVPIPEYRVAQKTLSQMQNEAQKEINADELILKSENELAEVEIFENYDPEIDYNDELESELESELEISDPIETEKGAAKKKQQIIYNSDGKIVKKIPSSKQTRKEKKKPAKAKKKKKPQKKKIPILPDTFPYFETGHPPAKTDTYTCSDSLCSEFLTESDKSFYKHCVSRFKISDHYQQKSHLTGLCHFMNGTGRSAVALASFPGSGNTWVRGLLERATGVCTGSLYCDNSLRAGGMNGEGVRSGAVTVVKTHKRAPVTWTTEDTNPANQDNNNNIQAYGAAVLIVRNPFHALVAEWSRIINGHTSQVPREAFHNNSKWNSFIVAKLPAWQSYFHYWVVGGANHRVLVVRFEDLKADVPGTVKKVLEFLRFPFDPQQVTTALSQDLVTFKRASKMDNKKIDVARKTGFCHPTGYRDDY